MSSETACIAGACKHAVALCIVLSEDSRQLIDFVPTIAVVGRRFEATVVGIVNARWDAGALFVVEQFVTVATRDFAYVVCGLEFARCAARFFVCGGICDAEVFASVAIFITSEVATILAFAAVIERREVIFAAVTSFSIALGVASDTADVRA